MNSEQVWVTWEEHRRSRELAAAFNARYLPFTSSLPNPFRYAVLGARTLAYIIRFRPPTIYGQNPSIVLACLLCLVGRMSRTTIVIDRHTNFYPATRNSPKLKWKIYHALGYWTDRTADLVIVTNQYLADFVRSEGGNSVVLPDPLPDLAPSTRVYDTNRKGRVVFVASGAEDEPLAAVLQAVEGIQNVVDLFVTSGRAKRAAEALPHVANVTLTGFLPYDSYINLLREADVIVILTTLDHTLCCGAYEATSLQRPMVLSDTQTIKSYFQHGAIYVAPDSVSIAAGIVAALKNWHALRDALARNDAPMRENWRRAFNVIQKQLPRSMADRT